MKTRIQKITLEIFIGHIESAIQDAKDIIRFTGCSEVEFLWNGVSVVVHWEDDPKDIIEKYHQETLKPDYGR